MSDVVLEMREVTKEFPGVRALNGITLQVRRGDIHTLIGENGAGKSTLLKVLSGVHPHGTYGGEILVNGTPARFSGTRDAEQAGVAIIHQELNLIPELSVAENIFLGHEPRKGIFLDWSATYQGARQLMDELSVPVDPRTPVKDLGVGRQQMVEIAKALRVKANVLLLDEPTSALTGHEVEVLFETLRRLKSQGVTCIYISHRLEELFAIGDRCTVIRDGATVGTDDMANLTEEKIVAMMVGREIEDLYPARSNPIGDPVLAVSDLEVDHPFRAGERIVQGIGFEARAGEVLGIAGLMGSGRSELLTALFGAFPSDVRGEVRLKGRSARFASPLEAIHAGVALVTEDRKAFGLILTMAVGENITLASLDRLSHAGVLDRLAETKEMQKWKEELRIKAATLGVNVSTLSGGNQQKVVFGKWLATAPSVMLLDEPTRGVDVGARVEMYRLMNRLLEEGMAVIMVSSSLPEVLNMSDRVLVMREGRQVALLSKAEADAETVMQYATGALPPQARMVPA
ncbi:MAG: sugar ABC transporter ATP-binding protein [Armatimonadetes bacterium]|nr:sugar ABC transporter ATP-binding protein [Armatimonadota bacterium]